MAPSETQPSFWIQPTPPHASVQRNAAKEIQAQACVYRLSSLLSLKTNDKISCGRNKQHKYIINRARTSGVMSPQHGSPRDGIQIRMGSVPTFKRFSIVIRVSSVVASTGISIKWRDCLVLSMVDAGIRLVKSNERQNSSLVLEYCKFRKTSSDRNSHTRSYWTRSQLFGIVSSARNAKQS